GACGHVCPKGVACVNGKCQCRAGFVPCGDTCVSPRSFATDPHNCGACGHVCGQGTTCAAGQCVPVQCPPGSNCGSGTATCQSYDTTYSTEGLCCAHGYTAYCCSDSKLGANDGSTGCCSVLPDTANCTCPNGAINGAFAGAILLDCCDPANATNPFCQANGQPLVGDQCCGWGG